MDKPSKPEVKIDKKMQTRSVMFKCPNCEKSEIIRSLHDRQIAAPYKCSECGFEGPN
jgi:predicted RNA-binding Zn-ribbon protein involved in translation (DUF1610 family)